MNLAVWSEKGGVGKSTLVAHLARAFSEHGPVAVADFDAQGATRAFEMPFARKLTPAQWSKNRKGITLFDCPPPLIQATPALELADAVLIPMQCEFLSFRATTGSVEQLQAQFPNKPFAVALTMFVPQLEDAREARDAARATWDAQVLATVIARDKSVSRASSDGLTVFDFAPDSRAARQFQKFSDEVYSWLKTDL